MPVVLEKDGKYVLKVYSHINKAMQLTDSKDKAMEFRNKESADWFITFMQLKNFNVKTK